ncbi:class I SAM-dependent DNA methyltransferase [Candidatus Hydrogenedentota bacterium]
MFSSSAQWYDALYSFKDYRQEAEDIIALLRQEHPEAESVLDIACGTAEHDRYLLEHYAVDGIDIIPEFVKIASNKNPKGEFSCADMTDFNLDMAYDIVLCLFSSIGYVKTQNNLVKTLNCFRQHLKADGIIVVEPWFVPEAWNPGGAVHMLTGETPEGKICRMNISEQKGSLSVMEFHYLIGTSDGVKHLTERHEMGLFSVDDMKNAFREAGLVVKCNERGLTGRGLYIASQNKKV